MTHPPNARWHPLVDSACRRPVAALVIFLGGLGLIVVLAIGRADEPMLDSDLFDLIDRPGSQALETRALERIRTLSDRRQTWMVVHEDPHRAYDAAILLGQRLGASDLFESTAARVSLPEILGFYEPYRGLLADDASLGALREGGEGQQVDRVEQALFSNTFTLPGLDLSRDPFLLQAGFLRELARVPTPWTIDRGLLRGNLEGRWTYLVPVTLKGNGFEFSYQELVKNFARALEDEVRSATGAEVASVGAIDFATANRELAMAEVGLIGGASLLLIALLLFITFRHVRPFFAVAFTIASGVAGGFAVCVLSFRSIHLLTLVGGSSLIGISVDYAFHLLADGYRSTRSWQVAEGLKAVLPTVTLGLLTSLAGFLGLYVSGFRGLQEIAVFSAAGLITAYAGLLMAYPFLLGRWRPPLAPPVTLKVAESWTRLWRPGRRVIAGLALGVAAVLPFAHDVDVSSDIRLLAADSPEIDALVHRSAQLSATLLDTRFIVVEARDDEHLLQREEALRARLSELKTAGALSHFNQLSQFVPSRMRQQGVWALNRTLFVLPGTAALRLAERIGLTESVLAEQRQYFAAPEPVRFLELSDWLESPLAPFAADLYLGPFGPQVASIVTLAGLTDPARLVQALDGLQGVRLVDNVANITRSFELYVDHALWGLAAAFFLVSALMILRFGWIEGAFTMLVPVVTFTGTLWLLQWMGEPINLFNVVGLTLVLGMGIDYTLFLKSGRSRPHTMLAILLAALTTECAFGLLGLSDVRAIHSFGITVALGTAGTFLLAQMVSGNPHGKRT